MQQSQPTRRRLDNVYTPYGGRRFLLTVGCGVVCTGLVICKVIPPEIFRDIIIATVPVFIAGDSYQKTRQGRDKDESADS